MIKDQRVKYLLYNLISIYIPIWMIKDNFNKEIKQRWFDIYIPIWMIKDSIGSNYLKSATEFTFQYG